jgi:RsiW-degrading membrane proteinase PrsW (M82 family)
MANFWVLLGLAFAPGIYLSVILYGKDKYDREPKRILLVAFLLGCLSILPAFVLETLGAKFGFGPSVNIIDTFIYAFIIVAFSEELSKFMMLRLHAFRQSAFNEPFDGIIYAAFVALGFATAENVLYVTKGGLHVAVLRMFTAVPAHYSFGVIMGYYVGKAKFEPEKRTAHILRGLLFATFMHGAYDFFLMQQNYPVLAIFTLGILIMGIRISRRSITELQADSKFRFHTAQALNNAPHENSKIE